MPKITIADQGCRGCNLCVKVCPTQVLTLDQTRNKALVSRADDCIGCTSCVFICPSRAIEVTEFKAQRPFHRIEENTALVERFVQRKSTTQIFTTRDYDEALVDTGVRLRAITDATIANLGRGHRAAGKKAGHLMAEHLPEMYEAPTIEQALAGIKRRFANSFHLESKVYDEGKVVDLVFTDCVLGRLVKSDGGQVGDAVLCSLFHEFWSGLLGAFQNAKYLATTQEVASSCTIRLESR